MTGSFHLRVVACAAALAVSMTACSKAPPADGTPPAAPPSAPPAPPTPQTPAVNADAQALATLEARVNEYRALHKKLDATLPALKKEATPQEIDTHQRELARLVQESRKGAKPGDIFTPECQVVIKQLLARVFGGEDGRQLKASIMDENPVGVKLTVNGRYPDTVPLSTVPPQVLAGLPKLPDELEFRFIGDRLILLDGGAHIIVDFIENALPENALPS
jgi:hypothetical protein